MKDGDVSLFVADYNASIINEEHYEPNADECIRPESPEQVFQ